jgi:FtsH-binding integral membrane protein
MLNRIAFALVAVSALGLLTSNTLGGFTHFLFVVALGLFLADYFFHPAR